MNFIELPEDKKQALNKLKPFLIYLLIAINSITLIYRWTKPIFLNETRYSNSSPPLKRICEIGFKSLLDQNADENLFSESVYDYLEEGNYTIFEFKEDTKISYISLKDNRCTVITSDPLGLRSFKIILKKSSKPFLFAITNIEENQPKGI